jgi:hypothetical protein
LLQLLILQAHVQPDCWEGLVLAALCGKIHALDPTTDKPGELPLAMKDALLKDVRTVFDQYCTLI